MKQRVVILSFLLIALSVSSYAQRLSMKPPIPFEDRGACPFECCIYRKWNATEDTTVLKERRDDSAVVFMVKKRETVTAITGVVITTEPGQATVLKPVMIGGIRAKPGDVIYLLTNIGEGYSKVWYKGRFAEAEVYTDEAAFKVVSEPKSVWWVKLKNRKGQIGWSRQPENFDNKDACG